MTKYTFKNNQLAFKCTYLLEGEGDIFPSFSLSTLKCLLILKNDYAILFIDKDKTT